MLKKASIILLLTLLVGFAAGGLSLCYRLLLELAESLLRLVLALEINHYLLFPLWFVVLLLIAWWVSRIIHWNPGLSGGGISQMLEVYRHRLPNCWWKNVIGNMSGGTLSLFAGLSIGTESPVIQLAASLANGITANIRAAFPYKRMMMAVGAATGFAVGFSAPVSGIVFAMTELRKKFHVSLLFCMILSVASAYYIVMKVFGFVPFFRIVASVPFCWRFYVAAFILGLILALSGVFYNYVLVRTQFAFDRLKNWNVFCRLLPAFCLAGVLAFTVPDVLGSGSYLWNAIHEPFTIRFLILMFVLKFVFSMLSPSCGVPGGLMYPMLMLGALIGKIFGESMSALGVFPGEWTPAFIIFGMSGYFIASVRNLALGILLILEMTWQFDCIMGLLLVGGLCYYLPNLIKTQGIYDALADRLYARYLRRTQTGLPMPRNLEESHVIMEENRRYKA